MFLISEVAPSGQASGQSQTQSQVIASVVAQQRVIAAQAGAESGDASARNFSGSNPRDKAVRQSERDRQRTEVEPGRWTPGPSTGRAAETRSIIEAQEASLADRKIVAAFQARHGLTDLLSVIRDPEDRMLPNAPES